MSFDPFSEVESHLNASSMEEMVHTIIEAHRRKRVRDNACEGDRSHGRVHDGTGDRDEAALGFYCARVDKLVETGDQELILQTLLDSHALDAVMSILSDRHLCGYSKEDLMNVQVSVEYQDRRFVSSYIWQSLCIS